MHFSREVEGAVKVQWVPGHAGIKGNERVDVLAREACSETTTRTKASIYRAKSLIKERHESSIIQFWKDHAPSRYRSLKIPMTGQMPEELQILSRKNLALLLAARSAHGDYATYHRRFQHQDAKLLCICGEEKAPEHPFACRKLDQSKTPRPCPSRGKEGDIMWILGTSTGVKEFGKWCNTAHPYEQQVLTV